ncbi:MAG: HaeII family restriction endonuclease [Nitrospira sp.]|nr:HaeII family restriction endonuclease [Nitrospira sp.]
MARKSTRGSVDAIVFCKDEIERMLTNSQTKAIMPVITSGLLREFLTTGKQLFTDSEIEVAYKAAVKELKEFLGHDVYIGGKYYDAYGNRMSRYRVLKSVGHLRYKLLAPYTDVAKAILDWIPLRIERHIQSRLGVVPSLHDLETRTALASDMPRFLNLIQEQISKTPANFEVFSFAVLKVHLEKFACKIYRDTRTAAHDQGVDLSTNFGVVYQVKKLRIHTELEAAQIYGELKRNFDNERIQNGNVVLVIDDVSKEVKKYLVDMKVQLLKKEDVVKLASNFDEQEDRQKVLRIVYEEFRREYSSRIS